MILVSITLTIGNSKAGFMARPIDWMQNSNLACYVAAGYTNNGR
jgi:hypothetical protein